MDEKVMVQHNDVSSPIKVPVRDGTALIYNLAHVQALRMHRISGSMDGPLPNNALQDKTLGLPMMLMKEAATLLQEIGVIELVSYPDFECEPSDRMDLLQRALEKADIAKQKNKYFEERKKQISKHGNKILASAIKKNSKLSKSDAKYIPENELTLDRVIEEKVKSLPDPKPGSFLIQNHTEYPFIQDLLSERAEWEFPKSEKDHIRYVVYKDLWKRGYWVVCGSDSSVDFLIYKGDPVLVHAILAVAVSPSDKNITECDRRLKSSSVTDARATSSQIGVTSLQSGVINADVSSSQSTVTSTAPASLRSVVTSTDTASVNMSGNIPVITGACSIFDDDPGILVSDLAHCVRVNETQKRGVLLAFVNRDNMIDYHTVKWRGFEFGGMSYKQ